jgi:hypothetical protein
MTCRSTSRSGHISGGTRRTLHPGSTAPSSPRIETLARGDTQITQLGQDEAVDALDGFAIQHVIYVLPELDATGGLTRPIRLFRRGDPLLSVSSTTDRVDEVLASKSIRGRRVSTDDSSSEEDKIAVRLDDVVGIVTFGDLRAWADEEVLTAPALASGPSTPRSAWGRW